MFRTMLIEDNPIFREVYKAYLSHEFPSMEIIETSNGEEALRKMDRVTPGLIFIDIRLRDENGLLLIQKIKMVHPETTIVIFTSYDYAEYREAAMKMGADHYLTKTTTTPDEVIRLVKKILTEKGYPLAGR
jgi:DNA-binding NarL/FixJ family response regulator